MKNKIWNLPPRWMQPLKMVILCVDAFVWMVILRVAAFVWIHFLHIAAKVFAPEMDEELLIVV
jgi:hypothetical protein